MGREGLEPERSRLGIGSEFPCRQSLQRMYNARPYSPVIASKATQVPNEYTSARPLLSNIDSVSQPGLWHSANSGTPIPHPSWAGNRDQRQGTLTA